MLGAGLLLTRETNLLANDSKNNVMATTPTKGYAASDTAAFMRPWSFERRAVGDNDVLIDIKYCGICHSDIHQMKGHWGPQQYPQVPGHEIAGIVTAVGKNVTKFKVGDQAGVGCMVDSCLQCESCKKGEEHHCEKGFQGTYGELTVNNFNMIFNRVNFNGSLIGGIPETQEIVDYCAKHKIYPQIQVIPATQINDAWEKVVNKEARYRYVIDTSTL